MRVRVMVEVSEGGVTMRSIKTTEVPSSRVNEVRHILESAGLRSDALVRGAAKNIASDVAMAAVAAAQSRTAVAPMPAPTSGTRVPSMMEDVDSPRLSKSTLKDLGLDVIQHMAKLDRQGR